MLEIDGDEAAGSATASRGGTWKRSAQRIPCRWWCDAGAPGNVRSRPEWDAQLQAERGVWPPSPAPLPLVVTFPALVVERGLQNKGGTPSIRAEQLEKMLLDDPLHDLHSVASPPCRQHRESAPPSRALR